MSNGNAIPQWIMGMDAGTWRGYSAYEVAVQHGFRGTEAEWLESLKGAPGKDAEDVTVNGVEPVDGNIMLKGNRIPLSETSAMTVEEAIKEKVSGTELEPIRRNVEKKAWAKFFQCDLIADAWVESGETITQVVNVEGMEEEGAVVVAPDPVNGQNVWQACNVRCYSQRNGGLAFAANVRPEEAIHVNVILLKEGVLE